MVNKNEILLLPNKLKISSWHTKPLLAAFIFLLFAQAIAAQSPNPYNSIGKASKIVTLTKGEYEEFFDEDSVQRIGSAFVNVNTMKVVSVNLTKQEKRQLDNAQESRFLSVDPLTRSFPMLTPYQYASNRPIDGIDADGLEWATYTFNTYKSNGDTWLKVKQDGYSDTWLDEIGGAQFWLRPDGSQGQGILFNSYKEMFDAAKKFASGKADFNKAQEACNDGQFDNFMAIAALNLADHLNAAADEYISNKIKSGGPTEEVNVQATTANGGNTGAAKSNTAVKNKPQSPTIQQKKIASITSQAIVRERLTAQLGTDEILMEQPRFYINDGKNYSTPDFAIYNTKEDRFVRIPDAKNGNGDLTPNQKILNENGGEFRGSSRYPQAKPQSIAPGMVKKETTQVPYN